MEDRKAQNQPLPYVKPTDITKSFGFASVARNLLKQKRASLKIFLPQDGKSSVRFCSKVVKKN